jgi:FHS family L-fucose permease-like MFS transporter
MKDIFFFCGIADDLNNILIPQLKKALSLESLRSSLAQYAICMGYFLVALPAGFLMVRFGYKAAALKGLVLNARAAVFGGNAARFYALDRIPA